MAVGGSGCAGSTLNDPMFASMTAFTPDTVTSWPKPERSRSTSAATAATVAHTPCTCSRNRATDSTGAPVVRGLPPRDAEGRREQPVRFRAAVPGGVTRVRRGLHQDETRTVTEQPPPVQAVAGQRAGVGHQAHVGPGDELRQPAAAAGVRRVGDDALLAAIPGGEPRQGPRGVACRRLDLDDLGAEVGQEHADGWSRDPVTEVDYLHAFKDVHDRLIPRVRQLVLSWLEKTLRGSPLAAGRKLPSIALASRS